MSELLDGNTLEASVDPAGGPGASAGTAGHWDDDAGNRLRGGTAIAVLEYVARSIVDEPEAVVVDAEEGHQGVTLRLHVAPDDMGKVIGKRGRVAQAIRAVVRAAGAREGLDAQVEIVG